MSVTLSFKVTRWHHDVGVHFFEFLDPKNMNVDTKNIFLWFILTEIVKVTWKRSVTLSFKVTRWHHDVGVHFFDFLDPKNMSVDTKNIVLWFILTEIVKVTWKRSVTLSFKVMRWHYDVDVHFFEFLDPKNMNVDTKNIFLWFIFSDMLKVTWKRSVTLGFKVTGQSRLSYTHIKLIFMIFALFRFQQGVICACQDFSEVLAISSWLYSFLLLCFDAWIVIFLNLIFYENGLA